MLENAPTALAFEPGWDYWLVETITVGDTHLPDGVSIRSTNTSSQPRASLVLENQTDLPLFVLSLAYKPVLVMPYPDPLWKARVAGAGEVASYLVSADKPRSLNMDALADLDHDLVDHNVLRRDPPPTDLPIPAPQASELLLVYGEQVLLVPFSLSYSLNTQFDNNSQVNQHLAAKVQPTNAASATQEDIATHTQGIMQNRIVLGLVGLVILFFGALIWGKLFRG